MSNISIELMLRGIEYEASNHCNHELWIKDRYVIGVYGDGRVVVHDRMMESMNDAPMRLFWGTWQDLFNQPLVEKFYGRKFE